MTQPPAFQKPAFIVNPHSANGSTQKEWPQIEKAAQKRFPGMIVKFTRKVFEAPSLVREALAEGADLVVSVGGDGTHNEVVNGFFEGEKLIREDVTLGILSRGTGGDFRRTLGLSRCTGADMIPSVEQLANCTATPCDVGRLTFFSHDGTPTMRYFINIASCGIGGEIDKIVNESSKVLGGKASFFIGSLRASLAYKNRFVKVLTDGKLFFEGRAYSINVANGKYFGGGMMIAPDAQIDDGLFDVVASGDYSIMDALNLSRFVYSGKHLGLPKISVTRAKMVEVFSDEKVLLDVDGEAPGRVNAKFENISKAIRVLKF